MKSVLFLALFTLVQQTNSSGSPNYDITPATMDSGGGIASSDNYTVKGSIGQPGGTATSNNLLGKLGYIGQLYDITGLALAATPATLDEGSARQLSATATLDDGTALEVNAEDVVWSVLTGPLTGITSVGLATAAMAVYQDTAATAQGDYAGFTATLGLTVLNTIPDNFGSYAGDGLGDDWQFANFGLDNPNAGPLLDPDGDGQNNHFEFTAGLVPTDPLSRFLLKIEPIPGLPQQKNLVFEPLVDGRTYTVRRSIDLSPASWTPLPGSPPTSNTGAQRTVTDTAATETKYFYHVEITKP